MTQQHTAQVVIIGGGLSGLSAAKLLTDNGVGVIVLEARDRVGGRTFTSRNNIIDWVDLGGSYTGPSQNHILRLAKELGVETYRVFSDLGNIQYSKGKRFIYTSQWVEYGWWSPLAWFDIICFMNKMEKMMKEVPMDEPWNCPHALEWDDTPVKQFIEKECWTKGGKEFILAVMQANMASEPAHISLLWVLWYTKCCGGNKRMWNVDNGAQERKFVGGSMTISEKLGEILGDKLHLNSSVCSLTQSDNGVTIVTTEGVTYSADYVIMAIPLPMQLKVHYEPALPALRNQLIQRAPVGCVIKANLYYTFPFWRQKGFNGFISCADSQLVVGNVLDDCRPDFPLAALTVFIFTDHAIRLQELSREARMKIIARDLARAYGCDDALHPFHYEEHNWLEEQYSGGCYVSTFSPGVLSRYGKILREPFMRVYFAGTETATSWPGYMNGAVQAGERAAKEILNDMNVILKEEIFSKEPEFKEIPAKPFDKTFIERYALSLRSFILSGAVGTSFLIGGLGWMLYYRLK